MDHLRAFLAYFQRDPTTIEVASRYIFVLTAGFIGAVLFCPPINALLLSWGTIYGTRFPPPSLNSIDAYQTSKNTLSYSPNRLSRTYIVKIVFTIIYKTVTLRYLTQRLYGRKVNSAEVPIPALQLDSVFTLTRADLELFATSLDGSSSSPQKAAVDPDTLRKAAQNPLLVPALTTPLLILTLTHPSVQLNPLGAVNVRNRFEIHQPARLQSLLEPLCVESKARSNSLRLQVSSYVGGAQRQGRYVKRGLEFDVRIEVSETAEPGDVKTPGSVEENKGALLMVQELTFLQFLPKGSRPLGKPDTLADSIEPDHRKERKQMKEWASAGTVPAAQVKTNYDIDVEETVDDRQARRDKREVNKVQSPTRPNKAAVTHMNLTPQDPRRWAGITKDYNPIHVSPLLARLFGFKGVIAHGNHVAAKVFADHMSTSTVLGLRKEPYTVEVQFRRPVVLPETPVVETKESAEEARQVLQFRVLDTARKKEYVVGHAHPLWLA